MDRIRLRSIIREMLEEESQAAKDAKSQGLTNLGFGRWGKDGTVTHKSDGGRLVPVKSADDVGLRPGKTPTSKNKLYKQGSSTAQAKKLQTGPNKGKVQRLAPKLSPGINRNRNKPQDSLNPTAKSSAYGQAMFGTGADVKDRARTVYSKLSSKVHDVATSGEIEYGKSYSTQDFLSKTKMSQKEFDVMNKLTKAGVVDDYESTFITYPDDTVYVQDPDDV